MGATCTRLVDPLAGRETCAVPLPHALRLTKSTGVTSTNAGLNRECG
jgi:hypothetical protein